MENQSTSQSCDRNCGCPEVDESTQVSLETSKASRIRGPVALRPLDQAAHLMVARHLIGNPAMAKILPVALHRYLHLSKHSIAKKCKRENIVSLINSMNGNETEHKETYKRENERSLRNFYI